MQTPALLPSATPWLRRSTFAMITAGLLSLAGCSSPRPPAHAHYEAPQPPLAGRAEFLTGALVAEARVASFRSTLRPIRPDSGDDELRGHGGGHRPPPPGAGGGMSPRHGGGGGMGGPPGGGDRRSGDIAPSARGRTGFAALPRQMLRVTFTNRSTAALTFTIAELNSAIGNFVPQPGKLTLAPGATAALEPVSGDAGGNLEWLDLTLAVRRAGQTEKQLIHLVATGELADAPPPPPPEKR
ncbi:MAG TPA: hypothetical protein VK178_18740 [Opitutaceae bacterium]|nr:hypothetical protein [Opitutaceae bacterium]